MTKIILLFFFLLITCVSCNLNVTNDNAQEYNSVDFQKLIEPCLLLNDISYTSQIDFKGILPGKSTKDEVVENFGQPISAYSSFDQPEDSWEYDGFTVRFQNGIIDMVIEFGNQQTLTLRSIVNKFGCPDVMFDVAPGEENPFGKSLLFFSCAGMELLFEGMEISLEQKPDAVFYSIPSKSIIEFLQSKGVHEDFYGMPVSWSEIVRK